jgi:hypothetical protein
MGSKKWSQEVIFPWPEVVELGFKLRYLRLYFGLVFPPWVSHSSIPPGWLFCESFQIHSLSFLAGVADLQAWQLPGSFEHWLPIEPGQWDQRWGRGSCQCSLPPLLHAPCCFGHDCLLRPALRPSSRSSPKLLFPVGSSKTPTTPHAKRCNIAGFLLMLTPGCSQSFLFPLICMFQQRGLLPTPFPTLL